MTDLDSFINLAKELDGILITVSAENMFKICKDLLPLKIPLFIEKPPALSLAEIDTLVHTSLRYNTPNMVGFNRRFYSIFHKGLEKINEYGGLVALNIEGHERFWRYKDSLNLEVKNSWIYANSSHTIDFIDFFVGDLENLYINSNSIQEEIKDQFSVTFKSKEGVIGNYSSYWLSPGGWSVSLYGKGVSVIFRPLEEGIWIDSEFKQHPIEPEKYDLEIIDTPKLENIYHLPINFFYIIILIIKSIFVLKNRKIKKIISIGGYMSLPLIIAARLTGLSIYLVEPNHVLGRANKFFLNFCKNIFCYSRSIKNFPKKFENKIIIISPLVKKEIYELSCLNIKKNRFNLLIVGGSQGASFFDKNLKNIILSISRKNLIRIIQQTNKLNVEKLKDFYSKNNIESKIFNFDKEFSKVIHQADLCITRAGASTLAELSVLNIPFIAVPLPSSKDNHQFENANFYKKNNCCWTLDQDDFEEKIESLLVSILNNKIEYFNSLISNNSCKSKYATPCQKK